MNHEKHEKTRKKKVTTDHTENTEVGFTSLVGLFKQTQTTMQSQAAKSVDIALVVRNWLFGWYIVEFENGGAERAELYGKALIKRLSATLSAQLGKGFSQRSLEQFRNFYMHYTEIAQTASAQSSDELQKIRQTLSDQSILPLGISETASRKSEQQSLLPAHFWQKLSTSLRLSKMPGGFVS